MKNKKLLTMVLAAAMVVGSITVPHQWQRLRQIQ